MPAPNATVGDGRYTLVEHLADGSASSVWRAHDTELDLARAVKILDRGAPETVRSRFLQEGRLLSGIRHPNLVAIHDVGGSDARPFLVMELMTGGSLADRGALAEPEARRHVLGVLSALAEVHARGIVHRDLNPANILLDARGTAHLIDFGAARADGGATTTRTGHRLGELAYAAPEQLADARAVDTRADVYSAGAVLCALLTGEAPFALTRAEERDALLARLPLPARDVVARATRSRPGDRYPSATDMAWALRSTSVSTAPARRRWPPIAVAGGLLALAALVWLLRA